MQMKAAYLRRLYMLVISIVLFSYTLYNVSTVAPASKRSHILATTLYNYASSTTPAFPTIPSIITTNKPAVIYYNASSLSPQSRTSTTEFDSYVFATVLTRGEGTVESIRRYVGYVGAWIRQLVCHGIPAQRIVIVVADSVDESDYAHLTRYNVSFSRVPALSISGTQARYRDQVTKLHLWTLVSWYRVIYYDSDMFFMRSPLQCLRYCNISTELCAVPDIPGTRTGNDRYFNAGFMILRPSIRLFNHLVANLQMAAGRAFAEQDMLNDLFIDSYTVLPRDCNVVWPRKINDIGTSPTAVALHDKLDWVVQNVPANHPIRVCANIN
jgi:hypothetical protein